ncbi:MAG: CapA family protein [Patescibacteria group bacterium]
MDRAENESIEAEDELIVLDNSLPANEAKKIRMVFFGDLMLDRNVGAQIKKTGLHYLFEELEKNGLFSGFDLVSANLEGAVTENGGHYAPVNAYDFAFNPSLISELKKYDFSFFNLANNHFTDQGERGTGETRENLDRLSFGFSGCADRQVGDCSTKIIEVGGKKIGMAGFSMVYGLLDNEKAKEEIAELKNNSDLVIVNAHWGEEYTHHFNKHQEKLGHDLIDAGADMIIGHHPHVVQGVEIYKDKPIFYSLGNFVFDQYFSADTQEELAIEINFSDDKKEFILHPMQSVKSQPRLLEEDGKNKFLEKYVSWSKVSKEVGEEIRNGKIILK